jgi:hypothetical protein
MHKRGVGIHKRLEEADNEEQDVEKGLAEHLQSSRK